jgi:metal-dependent hydrolase (beta-lactamase superfamily II)
MIRENFAELRAVVERSSDLPEATRTKLLQLADELEQEVMNSGAAERAAELEAEAEAAEAEEQSENTDNTGLVSAIEGFEASHPELSNTVNNVAAMLSKLGF